MAYENIGTFTAGQVLTAAQMNEVGGNLNIIGGAWTSWTPQVYQAADRTSSIQYAKYLSAGKLTIVSCAITVTAAGSSGSRIEVQDLPVTVAAGCPLVGAFYYVRTGVAGYAGSTYKLSDTSLGFAYDTTALIGQSPAFATSNGDTCWFTVTYEAA